MTIPTLTRDQMNLLDKIIDHAEETRRFHRHGLRQFQDEVDAARRAMKVLRRMNAASNRVNKTKELIKSVASLDDRRDAAVVKARRGGKTVKANLKDL